MAAKQPSLMRGEPEARGSQWLVARVASGAVRLHASRSMQPLVSDPTWWVSPAIPLGEHEQWTIRCLNRA